MLYIRNRMLNNMHILSELLKKSKTTEGVVVVQLNVLSKAFDTIPHEAIEAALRKKGLPELMMQLVVDSFENVHMKIANKQDIINIKGGRGSSRGTLSHHCYSI